MSAPLPSVWPWPEPRLHEGQFVRLAPLDVAQDAAALFAAGQEAALWQYAAVGPFAEVAAMAAWLARWQSQPDVVCYTVTQRASGRMVGMISVMRITPAHGVAELGMIWYAPAAQRTAVNTETVYLLLQQLFTELHYRRVEWKCDDQNARSRAAALRLGFQYEGTFRQHLVVKGHNRDTAWFALLDHDWPRVQANFARWLYTDQAVSLGTLNRTPA